MPLPAAQRRSHANAAPVAPAWFRYGVIGGAILILCSCTAARPVKGQELQWDGEAPAELPVSEAPPQFGSAGASPSLDCAPQYPEFLPSADDDAACQSEIAGCPCDAPVRGPSDEYLCDGGDHDAVAAVRKDRTLDGVEQEDTVAHYDSAHGAIYVVPSNKVCIYAPRFAVVRQVIDLRENTRYQMVQGSIRQTGLEGIIDSEAPSVRLTPVKPVIDRANQPPSLMRVRGHAGELAREQRPGAAIGSLASYCDVQVVQTGEYVGRDIVKIARASLAAITWAGNQAPQILIDDKQAVASVSVKQPGIMYHLREPSDPRLRLVKLASTDHALPGEEVEFTLRYDNVGNQVLSCIAIVDSLTTRLEYVEGSQKADRDAQFSTDANSCDSLVLRWKLAEPLKPGEGGVLQFRCRMK